MEIRTRFLRWFRKFLLRQIHAECRRLAKFYKLDETEMYKDIRILGILAALDDLGLREKKTLREIINWYLYGMDYVRAYAKAKKSERKYRNPFEFVDRQKDDPDS